MLPWTEIWNYLSRADVVFGLLAALFSGFTALKMRQQNKRLKELAKTTPRINNFKEMLQYYSTIQTSKPVALAISLIPTSDSISDSVKKFLKCQDWKMGIEEIKMNGLNNPDDLETLINELRKKRRLLEAQQATEIHLFMAGPVVAGAIIGAIFDNWIPVKLYHKPQPAPPAIYEYWMPLIK